MTDHNARLGAALDKLHEAQAEVASLADESGDENLRTYAGQLKYIATQGNKHHPDRAQGGDVRTMDTRMQPLDAYSTASGAYPPGDPNAPNGVKTSEDAPANLKATGKLVAAGEEVDLTNTHHRNKNVR